MDTGSKDCDLFIPEELFGKLKKQGLVPVRGDILLSARGTLGRCYIIQDESICFLNPGISNKHEIYNGVILSSYFDSHVIIPS